MITIDDFRKVELRVARVLEVADHPNANKLIVLKVDIGGEVRQLVAGLRGHYEAAALVGKSIVVATNLQPAILRGVESQGMLLAASDRSTGAEQVILLTLDRPAAPGSPVS